MIQVPESIREKTKASLNGDMAAFGSLFEWYRPRLIAHALRICGNTALTQDAVQDTFLSAYTHLSTLKNADSFYPWLKKILLNNCYQLLRRERYLPIACKHLTGDSFLQQSIDDQFEKISNLQRTHEVLRLLSEELRSCVMLRYFSSVKSYEEIALVLGIPVGTVRSRLSAAREKLSILLNTVQDADDSAFRESRQWSQYYFNQWNNLHSDFNTRNEFFNHLDPSLKIRFTSGKQGTGRKIIEEEINNDLVFGSSVLVNEVVSSGNISVIQASNINNPDYPDRCAPSMALVFFRKDDKVETTHIFDSPRP